MTATRLRSPIWTAALVVLTGMGLARFAPAVGQVRDEILRPHAWVNRVGPNAALASFAGAMLWVSALWLAVGLLAAMLSRLPGRPGTVARVVARRALPAALRSVVLASTGASLLISPVSAMAAGVATGGQPPTVAATPFWPLDQPDRPLPAPGWPISSGSMPPASSSAAVDPPVSATPGATTLAPGSSTPSLSSGATPSAAPPTSSPAVCQSPAPPTPPVHNPSPSAGSVTVEPGDSLWSIAAEQLGSAAQPHRVAVEWPYWYRANRKVIGDDPNLLRPGVDLVVPDEAMDSAR